MTTIPVTENWPVENGKYYGEIIYVKNSNDLLIWDGNTWQSQQGATGMTGPAGPQGTMSPEMTGNMNNLSVLLADLHEQFHLSQRALDIFMIDAIDKKEYVRLVKMLKSGDEESMKLAKGIIDKQHEKHF